ncbi:N-acetyltransferase [Bradyrhizobium sp. SSBR45G]|nr:N-acetyltransferase [Bradyrhizobium sp. SSBR45G]GLH88257.1 N-acetyltransferase [Bradyrhizobium sp. SSBR45R]
MTLRRLGADDAASFKAIRLEALQASPELFGSTYELENALDVAWFAGRLADAHVLGAFHAGKLVGTAGFSVQQGPKVVHKGRLWGMYVRPGARRLGLGRLLVRALLDVAREQVEIVQLTVIRDNEPARKLYDSLGFVAFGMEPRASKHGDRYYDETHMMLDFGRAADAC